MKILYAPYNIASMPAITMDALNKISGIETRGISIINPNSQSFGADPDKHWKRFEVYASLKNPVSFIKNVMLAEYYLCKSILWADVIIWQWDTRIYLPHFWFLKCFAKKLLVEWVGSDIRNPELVMRYNPYYKKEIENKTYSYPKESPSRSFWIQQKFKFLKAIPFLCPEMTLFLNRNLFPSYIPTFQRIEVKKYTAVYPDPHKKKINIVHTPSALGAKGTSYVRAIIEKLKRNYEFHYIEIHNKTHAEALQAIADADIFLDQFIGGSYGMATCEALAIGKPVFCYLMAPVIALLPEDCPIVNANPDTLEELLIRYISKPQLRYDTGIKSRLFAERYHDADHLAIDLMEQINTVYRGQILK